MDSKKLYLVDGYALIYRAYFALMKNPLSNRNGIPTGAFYGFAGYILRLLETYDCPYLAVVMDSAKPTFRHEMYDQYKANREAMPDELRAQLPFIRQFIDACKIPTVIQEGLEADDLIAALTLKAVDAGFDVFLVTRDKDLMQLVGPKVTMLAPEGAGVLSPLGVPEVKEKMGVDPHRIVDYLALIGDSSDNIPGVPGVGPKTAVKILEQVKDVETLLADTSVIANPKLRQKIDDNRDLLALSKRLVTLETDAPIVFSLDELARQQFNTEACTGLIREMECMSLLRSPLFTESTQTQMHHVTVITTQQELETVCASARKHGTIAVTSLTSGGIMSQQTAGCAVALSEKEAYYLPFAHDTGELIDRAAALPALQKLCTGSGMKIICHDLKSELHAGILPVDHQESDLFDCMLAAYLLDPGKRDYGIDQLAQQWLYHQVTSTAQMRGSGRNTRTDNMVPVDEAAEVSGGLSAALFALEKRLRPLLHEKKLWELFRTVELPLVDTLALMERTGIMVDTACLATLSDEYHTRCDAVAADVYHLAGTEFNMNSPKQIGEVLFDTLHLPAPKKTKTGAHATGVEVLERLADNYPIARRILDYRELQKLLSTYIDALPAQIAPATGRVHTSFNQTIAATGRLSSTDPNLQNIPIRSEDGKRIRDAFIPAPGMVLVSADYSQIELRILAHLSNDPLLRQAFAEDRDIHTQTASAIYQIFPEMVTPEMRRAAKTINFGLMYGMGPINLSRQLGISFAEARNFIETYFMQFPTIKSYMDSTIEQARQHGYVETMLGRRRYLPDISASNRVIREAAERTAINTPVQGTAADIIKLAMIDIHAKLPEAFPDAAMLLQVHDELVFELPADKAPEFREWAVERMSGAFTLSVPLKVEAGIGANWNEAH